MIRKFRLRNVCIWIGIPVEVTEQQKRQGEPIFIPLQIYI